MTADFFDKKIRLSDEALAARTVVIKPNFGYPKQHPVVTRMSLVAQAIDQFLEEGNAEKIVVIEGVCTKVGFSEVMEKVGAGEYFDLKKNGSRFPSPIKGWQGKVELADADAAELTEFQNPKPAFRFDRFLAPSILKESDVCISIAPLKKTMLNGQPLFSGTIKNLFGLLPREYYQARSPHSRGQLHRPNVHQTICDVYHTLGPFFKMGILDLECYYESKDWKPDRKNSAPVGKIFSGDNLLSVDLDGINEVNEESCEYQKLLMSN